MIKKYGITFLAIGKEHINEFNTTVKRLFDLDNHLDVFVVTDNKTLIENKNIHIREINEPFNYNLKRKSIEFAFEYHDTVVFMDTDVLITKKINFDYVTTLDEGLYVRWISDEVDYMSSTISIEDVLKTKYGKSINDENLKFINEFLIVIRIDHPENKKRFIDEWNNLYFKTLPHQLNNGYDGSLEGLIIYSICNKLGLKVERPKAEFFNHILNIGTVNQIRKTKIVKTII